MSFALFQNALLHPVELSVNRLLALDAASGPRLARLEGRTLALHGTRPELNLYITVRDRGLHLSSVHEGEPTASLHGPVSAMLGLLRRANITNLQPEQLELRGSTAFVQELQAVLLDLDVDWEYQLSKLIGDIPTSLIGDGLRKMRGMIGQTTSRLHENTVEFLHEETALFPTPGDLDRFYAAVGDLTLRVDRLQARVALLDSQA